MEKKSLFPNHDNFQKILNHPYDKDLCEIVKLEQSFM